MFAIVHIYIYIHTLCQLPRKGSGRRLKRPSTPSALGKQQAGRLAALRASGLGVGNFGKLGVPYFGVLKKRILLFGFLIVGNKGDSENWGTLFGGSL